MGVLQQPSVNASVDPTATPLDRLFSATYEELRRLAAAVGRRDGRATLNPTALVNEAYLRLVASLSVLPESRLHFRRIAARAMRQVLVEAARRRNARKRGGGFVHVTLEDDLDGLASAPEDLIALDEALDRLAEVNARAAQVIECRYFGGYSVQETADVLEVSESTVTRDWRLARAWLAVELHSR